MSDLGLNTQQLAVICALSSGATMTAAAGQAGVHRNTIGNWRRNSPPFQDAFADAQYDRALYFRERAEGLIELALKSIREILTDPKAPPSARLKAALAILQTASAPPAPMKSQPETLTGDQLAPVSTVHKDAQSTSFTDALPPCPAASSSPNPPIMHKDAQHRPSAASSPRPPGVHNSAQPPYRRENPKIGRNEACPCGSGKKYKRCCLNAHINDMRVSKEFVQRLASAP